MSIEYLTKEEIKIIADAVGSQDHSVPQSDRKSTDHFDLAMQYVRENPDKFHKMTLEQLFKWFYELGLNTEPSTPDMSIQDVFDLVESNQFIQMVQDCITNPSTSSDMISVDDETNVVTLVSECIGAECECSPNREDCCTHDYGKHCTLTIPMSRFNKLIELGETH